MQLTQVAPRRVIGLAIALLISTGSALFGQGGSSGTILGTVVDAAGAVVPNATVQVKNTATGQTQQVPTNGQGRFTIAEITIGSYDAQASAQGFKTVIRKGVTLTVGSQVVVDFALAVGDTQQTITVEGQVSQVEIGRAHV